MAMYHFQEKIVSRGKGKSFAQQMAYILRDKIRDCKSGSVYDFRSRKDLEFRGVFLPDGAPLCLLDPQVLTDALDRTERRRDAQLARSFHLALPVELSPEQRVQLLRDFCNDMFVSQGYCVAAAIHCGEITPSRRMADLEPVHELDKNPHGHLLVPFRMVDKEGFQSTKRQSRTHNNREYLIKLRERWAEYINRAYREAGLDLSVSHKSLAEQARERGQEPTRFPTPYIGQRSFSLEKQGIHTSRGDRYREIMRRNRTLQRNRLRGQDRVRNREL